MFCFSRLDLPLLMSNQARLVSNGRYHLNVIMAIFWNFLLNITWNLRPQMIFLFKILDLMNEKVLLMNYHLEKLIFSAYMLLQRWASDLSSFGNKQCQFCVSVYIYIYLLCRRQIAISSKNFLPLLIALTII